MPDLIQGGQAAAPAWAPGGLVGRYTLLGKIATGGMAEIWLARQVGPRGFEKVVVIKRIIDSYGSDPAFVEMFLDEARIAAQLNHPNIVQVHELAEIHGSYFIAMEYLHGESLSAVVIAGNRAQLPLSAHLAARIVAGAAEGLAHAHEQNDYRGRPLGIVHRDVSPMNIFVTYSGVVKVVDFGIAKAANRATQTANSLVKGKVAYMAPEQARGEEIDRRADVFALGVVLFEASTGTRLFKARDHLATYAAITGTAPIPLAHERNPKVPAGLSAVIDKALQRDVDARYQSARELQQALEAWLHEEHTMGGTGPLVNYLQQLFGERIKERNLMFERAQMGEFTPSRAERLAAANGTPTGASPIPGLTASDMRAVQGPSPGRNALGLVAAVVAVLVLGGGALYLGSRSADPTPPPPPPPTRALAVLGVDSDPPHAIISVDGVERGPAPVELTDLLVGDHRVSAALPGYTDASQPVRLERSGERFQVLLKLVKPQEPLTPPPPPPLGNNRNPVAPRGPPGTLNLDTQPWSRVYLKGKLLGDTPLLGLELPPGRHMLKLVNDEEHLTTTAEVVIRSGEVTAKKLRLK